MDGETELGFEVTLEMAGIGTGAVSNATATAEFGNVTDNIGAGMWDAQFYGPNAAVDATAAVVNTTLPTGVAGQFDVSSRLYECCRRIRGGEKIIIN